MGPNTPLHFQVPVSLVPYNLNVSYYYYSTFKATFSGVNWPRKLYLIGSFTLAFMKLLYFCVDFSSFHFLSPTPLICLGPSVNYQCHYSIIFSLPIQLPSNPLPQPRFSSAASHVELNRKSLKNLLLSHPSWPPCPVNPMYPYKP
jgi:hypothetical protein